MTHSSDAIDSNSEREWSSCFPVSLHIAQQVFDEFISAPDPQLMIVAERQYMEPILLFIMNTVRSTSRKLIKSPLIFNLSAALVHRILRLQAEANGGKLVTMTPDIVAIAKQDIQENQNGSFAEMKEYAPALFEKVKEASKRLTHSDDERKEFGISALMIFNFFKSADENEQMKRRFGI